MHTSRTPCRSQRGRSDQSKCCITNANAHRCILQRGKWRRKARICDIHGSTSPASTGISCTARIIAAVADVNNYDATCHAMFWDLDNIRPTSVATAILWGQHFKWEAFPDAEELDVFNGYGNRHTLRFLKGDGRKQLLEQLGMAVVEVPVRRDAADMQMASDAFFFGRQHQGEAGACVCFITNDKGLAPTLGYLTSQGLHTVAISEFPSARGAASRLMVPARVEDHELARAACRAVQWVPERSSG